MRFAPTASKAVAFLLLAGCGQAEPVQEIRAEAGAAAAAPDVVAAEGDWPWWYGPGLDGVAEDSETPVEWDSAENVLWRTDVPGRGHSSPIVVGDRVLLTTADEVAQTRMVLCYDRDKGQELWRKTVHQGAFMSSHQKNSHASATPASDGQRVFCSFIHDGGLWVTALSLEGEVLWQKQAGAFQSEHGYGPSPALYKSLVIVNGDNAGSSFLAALDRETGEIVWRVARERPGRHGSYATPVVREVAGKPQLLLPGHGKLTSYDPATGELLWQCEGPAEVAANSVACSDTAVFASGGYPEKEILAVRADGSGDVTDTHVLWRASKGVTYVPSPLYHEGKLFVVNDQGIASCFVGQSGQVLWQKRLGGKFSSSPVVAGKGIYVTDESGTTYVLAASDKYQVLGENKLGDRGFATPAVTGGRLFLRTGDALFCIASEEK